MTNFAASLYPYLSWRRSLPEFARKMSGRVQSITAILACYWTIVFIQ
jgi:hypothetical protein